MDKNIIMELLMHNVEKNKDVYSEEDIQILTAIEDAIVEMNVARSMFNNVSDPKLIDIAMHTEDMARSRYEYLILMAKQRNLRKKVN